MRIVFTIFFLCLFFSSSNLFGEEQIVKITLEKGNTDVLTIKNKPVKKAYIYGTHKNLIKFLIHDKFIQHNINQGVVYNFIVARSPHNNLSPGEINTHTNKILVLTEDSLSYVSVYNKINPENKDPKAIFRLAKINNLDIFVSYQFHDSFFTYNEEISQVILDKEKSDVFLIDGEPMSLVSLYGTKENIVKFLINDKFIRHKMQGNTNYSFSNTSMNNTLFDEYFKDISNAKAKIMIVIDENSDFLNIYNMMNNTNKKEISEDMFISIEDNIQISLIILPPGNKF